MATTTNYSWTTPDNSGLVKNGAQDIRNLGSAVDTSVWNIGFGQAGKNKIINGDFGIWQRGTSLVGTGFIADRYQGVVTTTTLTQSQQTFTPGAAPVAGYESSYFYRALTVTGGTAGSRALVQQKIEDVRTFAASTVTVSFWAKAASGTPKIGVELVQDFGSGGSTVVTAIGATAKTISTSWARYSVTASLPSISGKTIGTGSSVNLVLWVDAGSDFATRASSIGNQSNTFDIWGVQLEAGSTATAFQTATGTIQGELAACQRYFWRHTNDFASAANYAFGGAYSLTQAFTAIRTPVTMRIAPTVTFQAASNYTNSSSTGSNITNTAISANGNQTNIFSVYTTVASGLVAGNATAFTFAALNNYYEASAEL